MNERVETLAGQIEWAAKNFAYNLDFIPDDKLNWKPAASANSALEVAGHVVMALNGLKGMIEGVLKGDAKPEFGHEAPNFSSRDDAKAAVISAGESYAQTLRAIPENELNKQVEMPFGKFPLAFIAGMGTTDTIHHHGQIAYIQTLLGDTESHFDMTIF